MECESKWINPAEKLPGQCNLVLVALADGVITTAMYNDHADRKWCGIGIDGLDRPAPVIAWMELPKHPYFDKQWNEQSSYIKLAKSIFQKEGLWHE